MTGYLFWDEKEVDDFWAGFVVVSWVWLGCERE